MDSPSAIGEDSSRFCGGSEESSTTGPGQRLDETAVGPGYRSKLNNLNITITLIKMDLQEMGRETVCHQKGIRGIGENNPSHPKKSPFRRWIPERKASGL